MSPIDIDIERLTYLFNPRASLSGLREVWNISPKSRRVAYVVFWVFGVQPCIPFAHETHNCHVSETCAVRVLTWRWFLPVCCLGHFRTRYVSLIILAASWIIYTRWGHMFVQWCREDWVRTSWCVMTDDSSGGGSSSSWSISLAYRGIAWLVRMKQRQQQVNGCCRPRARRALASDAIKPLVRRSRSIADLWCALQNTSEWSQRYLVLRSLADPVHHSHTHTHGTSTFYQSTSQAIIATFRLQRRQRSLILFHYSTAYNFPPQCCEKFRLLECFVVARRDNKCARF